jgi:hypothetical protein
VHLARPILCVGSAAAARPARILVIGDCHDLMQQGAGSHHHDDGGPGICGQSNYLTCVVRGSSAHGLGNPNSTSRVGPTFSECIRVNAFEIVKIMIMSPFYWER